MTRAEVVRWLKNPVLLEWAQSTPFCDLERKRTYEGFRVLLRGITVRAVPVGTVILALGFWFVGRIPHGPGPILYSLEFMAAATTLLIWPLLYGMLRLGLLRPKDGTSVRVRLRVRGMDLLREGTAGYLIKWSTFDAFDFGVWQGFHVLKLRVRGTWLSRRFDGQAIGALEFGEAGVSASAIKQVLLDRGLREEPLGDPRFPSGMHARS